MFVQGRLARSVLAEVREAGVHRVPFDGSGLPSGIYFARMSTPGFVKTQKIVLLR
ncbi:MAG: T9SS type A sorting domain-containing protein [bacterium]|nr:T9SS type A sorting domain-containing protein [bacterium]